MGKIVGKALISTSLFFCAVSLHARITLKAFDVDGNVLEQAAVGQPFMLEVIIEETK